MDVKALLAAAPFLAKLYRRLPGPLKVVVLVAGAVVAVWYWTVGRHEDEADELAQPRPGPSAAGTAATGSES